MYFPDENCYKYNRSALPIWQYCVHVQTSCRPHGHTGTEIDGVHWQTKGHLLIRQRPTADSSNPSAFILLRPDRHLSCARVRARLFILRPSAGARHAYSLLHTQTCCQRHEFESCSIPYLSLYQKCRNCTGTKCIPVPELVDGYGQSLNWTIDWHELWRSSISFHILGNAAILKMLELHYYETLQTSNILYRQCMIYSIAWPS